jgi:ligand-binding SRPBCC domain-containing protein
LFNAAGNSSRAHRLHLSTETMSELFVKRTHFSTSAERLFAWHAEPEALERLIPPWEHSRVISRTGTIRDIGSRVELRARIGPFWQTWISEHTACEEGRMFRDVQIKGPFALWRHTHRFEPDGASACYLEDRVEYALPMGALGAMVAGGFVRRKLDRLFAYRHEVTASAFRAQG